MTARLIGMVHLAALPGSPLSANSLDEVVELAVADAMALEAGGADALIVENFSDVPFRPGRVDPQTIACMTRACRDVRETVGIDVGVNVLRNDGPGALSVALAAGCQFIRVNVHTGAMVTDQGIVSGAADQTLRLRRELAVEHIQILADVLVKHAVPLGDQLLEDAVEDLVLRGLADTVIVSGPATGKAAGPEEVKRAVASAHGAPVLVGSGVNAGNVDDYVPPASGVIAGTWLKRDGVTANPVDADRVRRLKQALIGAAAR